MQSSRKTSQQKRQWIFSALSAIALLVCFLSPSRVVADANEISATSPNARAGASIMAGRYASCVITNVGAVKCWGTDHVSGSNLVPKQVPDLTSGAVALTATSASECVLMDTGGVKCWGYNGFGLFGSGDVSIVRSTTPIDSLLTSGVKAIAGGPNHMCALLIAGTLKCWGSNGGFQLGVPSMGQDTTAFPQTVPNLSGVTAIAAGGQHTCVLLETTTVKCWGTNSNGELGNNANNTIERSPVDVYGLSGVVAITAGANHTCALKSNGQAYCWGRNYNGQLGISDGYGRIVPTLVTATSTTIASISAGDIHTCAALTTGAVKCWGPNWIDARLGDGSLTGAVAVTSGENHNCAALTTGAVKCWGANDAGQLGNGTTTSSYAAVQVTGLTDNVGVPTTTSTTTTTTVAPTTTSTTTTTTTTTTVAPTTTSTTTTTSVPTTSTSTSSTSTTSTSSTSSSSTSTSTTTPQPTSTTPLTSPNTTTSPTTTPTSPNSTVPTSTVPNPLTGSTSPPPTMAVTTEAVTTTTSPLSSQSAPTTSSTSTSTSTTSSSSTSPPQATTTTTTSTIPISTSIMNGDTQAISKAMNESSVTKASIFVNGKKTKAEITQSATEITVTVAGTSTSLTATAPDGSRINITSDGVLQAERGSSVSVRSNGFANYSPVETWWYPNPIKLGTETTNGIGASTVTHKVSNNVSLGNHRLVIRGNSSLKQSVTIGFAVEVTDSSIVIRIATSPFMWLAIIVGFLLALFIPSRIRRRASESQ